MIKPAPRFVTLALALGLCAPALARAQAVPASEQTGTAALRARFEALRARKLLSSDSARLDEVREILARGEALAQAGRHEDAVLLLIELVESPRFASYDESSELDAARYALGSSLHELGAEKSARAYLMRVISTGPDGSLFLPAFRKHTDVALSGLALAPIEAELSKLSMTLPEDAQNELRYLRARRLLGEGDDAAAEPVLSEITKHSRFYANAQYLLATVATRAQRYHDAEARLCTIASAGDDQRYSFYVDQRYFQVKDLARLGLGRVAHEMRRGDDAYYYYFQVPEDSPRLAESMFEAAYASYEGGDHDNATDLLDQLEARFPGSPYADEASLLRGYVALSRCEFEQARTRFSAFVTRFGPLLREIEHVLASPVRRAALYQQLARDSREGAEPRAKLGTASDAQTLLFALLRIDPVFEDLHERVRKLDAEVARSGRVGDELSVIAARLSGSDKPLTAGGEETEASAELDELRVALRDTTSGIRRLSDEIDTLRKSASDKRELIALDRTLSALHGRARELDQRIADARFAQIAAQARDSASSQSDELERQLALDEKAARSLPRRAHVLRERLVSHANARALAELSALRDRIASFLRRARIGRIDAIMGSKRRIEGQIESLSAGRFPAELRDPLLEQGFLRDDEEYWPFEGEDWPDEHEERYDDAEER